MRKINKKLKDLLPRQPLLKREKRGAMVGSSCGPDEDCCWEINI
jgi:hypothetical protein